MFFYFYGIINLGDKMIPKNIIFVWVGGKPKPQKVLDCMETWKKYMPEKEWNYIEINEETFDINENKYCKDAYENKHWAYVSDYLRLKALYEYGGYYLDTDVEVFKSLDHFSGEDFFTGWEQPNYPVCAVMGAQKGNKLIKEMLEQYEKEKFETHENWWEYRTNTMILSDILSRYIDRNKYEYQSINGITIYPRKYFTKNDENIIDDETYAEHRMYGSWFN